MLALFDIVEAFVKMIEGGFGIRYLLSPKYREKVHDRCRNLSKPQIALYVFETTIGIIFLGIIIYTLLSLLITGD